MNSLSGRDGSGETSLLERLAVPCDALLTLLFESLDAGLLIVDPHCRVVRASARLNAMVDGPAPLACGALATALFAPDDRPRIAALLHGALAGDAGSAPIHASLASRANRHDADPPRHAGPRPPSRQPGSPRQREEQPAYYPTPSYTGLSELAENYAAAPDAGAAPTLGLAVGVPVTVAVTPLREPDNSVSGALLRIVDVTAQATMELRMAEGRRLQTIGQMAGGIAHDFNNLLATILGAAECVLDRPGLDPDSLEDLRDIRLASERGAALVRQLLALSRRQTPKPGLVAVNQAVEAVAPLLRRLAGPSIRLTLTLERPDRLVHADSAQLDQLLINLVANARDAIRGAGRPDGVVTIRTSHRTLPRRAAEGADTIAGGTRKVAPTPTPHGPARNASRQSRQYVVIEVADNGPGIAPEVLPHIFEPFFTTRGESGGNGLGLSTVHGIVQRAGGFTTVDSKPDQGTTFRIHLPRQQPRREAPQTAATSHPAVSPRSASADPVLSELGASTASSAMDILAAITDLSGLAGVLHGGAGMAAGPRTQPPDASWPDAGWPDAAWPSAGASVYVQELSDIGPVSEVAPPPPGRSADKDHSATSIPAMPANPEAASATPVAKTERPRGPILLVEDEAMLRRFGERALRRAGWLVTSAVSAEDALAALAGPDATCPAVIISDVVMPGMDGPTLIQTLRRRWPHMPAILVSGYTESDARGDLSQTGIPLLAKPYQVKALLALVEAAIHGAALGSEQSNFPASIVHK